MHKRAFSTVPPLLIFLGILAAICGLIFASTQAALAVAPISQSYLAEKPIALGSLVSLDKNSSDTVSPATATSVDRLLGVAVTSNSPLTLTHGSNTQTMVATSGVVPSLYLISMARLPLATKLPPLLSLVSA